jgi:hypothetical protein
MQITHCKSLRWAKLRQPVLAQQRHLAVFAPETRQGQAPGAALANPELTGGRVEER